MGVEPVEVATADGLVLRGERWAGSGEWYALVHDVGEDIDVWRPLQEEIAAQGRSAVALDLRGHGGSDDGPEDVAADLAAAVGYARAEGAKAVCVLAAGAAAAEALRSAPDLAPDVLVLLSPRAEPGEVPELRAPGVPRLFLHGAGGAATDETVTALRNAAIGWAGSVAFPTDVQGAALLESEWQGHVLEHVRAFVREQLYIACG